MFAAEQALRAAEALEQPAELGIANYAILRSLFDTPGILRQASYGIDLLSPHVGTERSAAEAYGMHHLMAANIAAHGGDRSGALAHLAEARQVAAHTGERPNKLLFGPANVAVWRVKILTALGEGGNALADPTGRPESIPSNNRLAHYHVHRASALLQGRRRESEAISSLLRAEVLAPQLVRAMSEARTVIRVLLHRSRVGGRDLRALADRVGFAD